MQNRTNQLVFVVRRRTFAVWSGLCFKPAFPPKEAKVERKYVYKLNFVIIISVYARLRVAPFKCFNQFTDFHVKWYEHFVLQDMNTVMVVNTASLL
jgi:hypothetical protein